MITVEEVAELIVKMNDTNRQFVAQITELEARNKSLNEQLVAQTKAVKEQLNEAVPSDG